MAGGSGKYNQRLIADLAASFVNTPSSRPHPLERDDAQHQVDDSSVAASDTSRPAIHRHCWVLREGPGDPEPVPGLLVGNWLRQREGWFVRTVWYSEPDDAVIQEWLPAQALRPVDP